MYKQMKFWTQVRRHVLAEGHSKRSACRKFNIHWDTLEKILAHPQPPGYRQSQPRAKPKIDPFLRDMHKDWGKALHELGQHTEEVLLELDTALGQT